MDILYHMAVRNQELPAVETNGIVPVLYKDKHHKGCCHTAYEGGPGHSGHTHLKAEHADCVSYNVNHIHDKGSHHGYL